MATVFTRCRNPGWLMVLGLAIFAFAPGTASADLLDPATLHIGPNSTPPTADPVQIGNDGLVTVFQNQGGAKDLNVPWLVILGIPNVTTTTAEIDLINGSATGTPVFGTFKTAMTSSDAYTLLGLTGPNSNSFTNWSAADLSINGITATSFGLFEYSIPVTLGAKQTDTFQFANLVPGTFVIAYGETTDKKGNITAYSTPFTEAGLETFHDREHPKVPEPSTMVIAGLGALGFVAYGLRRRRSK